MNLSQQFQVDGLTVKIVYDPDPTNPRKEFDNFGTMVTWHRRYHLGDEQPRIASDDWLREFAAGLVNADYPDRIPDRHIARILEKHCVLLPLYLYDHSGITISTGRFSCPWDSGQVGWIYATLDDARKNWGERHQSFDDRLPDWLHEGQTITLREATRRNLEDEVETYDQYLTGEVYGYLIEDESGNNLDSCWGFFGEKYCEEQARSTAAHLTQDQPPQPL